MRAIWVGILFLSGSWLFLTPIFTVNYSTGLVLVILGCFFNILALNKKCDIKIDRKYYFICVALLIPSLFTPFPYNLGTALIISGFAAFLLSNFFQWVKRVSLGLIFSGLLMIIQSSFVPIYFKLAPRVHQLDIVTFLVFCLMKIFGMECAWSENTLFIQSAKAVVDFQATTEHLNIFLWIELSIGAMIVLIFFVHHQIIKWLFFILFSGLVYLVLRYVGLILLFLDYEIIRIFWNPWVSIASFVPLVLIFIKFILLDVKAVALNFILEGSNVKNGTLIAGSFITIFLLTGFWGFQEQGILKKGRILIDEKHSNWEWTTRKYDTTWFGQKSGYNYYCLWDYLNKFYHVDRNVEDITSQLLANYDIVIIKTPTATYSDVEIKEIREFVKKGGGLFLIGDHTNVFGSSTYINPIANQFGLQFNYDSTYDLATGGLSVYKPPRLFPHPAVQFMPPFLFGSSCTLNAPLLAEDVITGYGIQALYLDYSRKNFFPEKVPSTNMNFGLFLQSAGTKYGRGRVLAFTDSTVFSNFWMFMPGKPELLLGSINWLNRQNYFPYNINSGFLIVGLIFLCATIVFALKEFNSLNGLVLLVFSFSLAFPLAYYFYQTCNHRNYSPPKPHTKFTKICFDMEHSDIFLPITELVNKHKMSYHTFYVWVQRLGYVPMALPKLQDALNNGNIVVFVNPVEKFTRQHLSIIQSYVNEGGKIILMDNSSNKKSSANELLQTFDMSLKYKPPQNRMLSISDREILISPYSATVKGGEPIILTESKDAIVSVRKWGKGLIVVISDSVLFSDRYLGTTSTIPNQQQEILYKLEFRIFSEIEAGALGRNISSEEDHKEKVRMQARTKEFIMKSGSM